MNIIFEPKGIYFQIDFDNIKNELRKDFKIENSLYTTMMIKKENYMFTVNDIGKISFFKVGLFDIPSMIITVFKIRKAFKKEISKFGYKFPYIL